MYRQILVPIGQAETVSSVLVPAASLSRDWKDCTVTLIHVVIPVYETAASLGVVAPTPEGVDDQLEQEGQQILDNASRWLRRHAIEPKTVLKWGDPAHEICKYAEKENVDLIIVGSRDKGMLEKLLLGSVSQRVAQNAPTDVLVVK